MKEEDLFKSNSKIEKYSQNFNDNANCLFSEANILQVVINDKHYLENKNHSIQNGLDNNKKNDSINYQSKYTRIISLLIFIYLTEKIFCLLLSSSSIVVYLHITNKTTNKKYICNNTILKENINNNMSGISRNYMACNGSDNNITSIESSNNIKVDNYNTFNFKDSSGLIKFELALYFPSIISSIFAIILIFKLLLNSNKDNDKRKFKPKSFIISEIVLDVIFRIILVIFSLFDFKIRYICMYGILHLFINIINPQITKILSMPANILHNIVYYLLLYIVYLKFDLNEKVNRVIIIISALIWNFILFYILIMYLRNKNKFNDKRIILAFYLVSLLIIMLILLIIMVSVLICDNKFVNMNVNLGEKRVLLIDYLLVENNIDLLTINYIIMITTFIMMVIILINRSSIILILETLIFPNLKCLNGINKVFKQNKSTNLDVKNQNNNTEVAINSKENNIIINNTDAFNLYINKDKGNFIHNQELNKKNNKYINNNVHINHSFIKESDINELNTLEDEYVNSRYYKNNINTRDNYLKGCLENYEFTVVNSTEGNLKNEDRLKQLNNNLIHSNIENRSSSCDSSSLSSNKVIKKMHISKIYKENKVYKTISDSESSNEKVKLGIFECISNEINNERSVENKDNNNYDKYDKYSKSELVKSDLELLNWSLNDICGIIIKYIKCSFPKELNIDSNDTNISKRKSSIIEKEITRAKLKSELMINNYNNLYSESKYIIFFNKLKIFSLVFPKKYIDDGIEYKNNHKISSQQYITNNNRLNKIIKFSSFSSNLTNLKAFNKHKSPCLEILPTLIIKLNNEDMISNSSVSNDNILVLKEIKNEDYIICRIELYSDSKNNDNNSVIKITFTNNYDNKTNKADELREVCLLCKNSLNTHATLGCGHFEYCSKCAIYLLEERKYCLLCNTKITEIFESHINHQSNIISKIKEITFSCFSVVLGVNIDKLNYMKDIYNC